jgi:hypothetical protein
MYALKIAKRLIACLIFAALLVSEATCSALRTLQAALSSRTPSQPPAPAQHSHHPQQQQQKQRELSEPPAVHLYLQRLAPVFVGQEGARPPPEPFTTSSQAHDVTEDDGMQDTRRQLLALQRREWQAAYVRRPSRPVGRPCPIRTAFAAGASTIVRYEGLSLFNPIICCVQN